MKTKYWKCPLCKGKAIDSERAKKQHIQEHINDAYENEMEWFEIGREAENLYTKMFEK
jgi:hypothetical protein